MSNESEGALARAFPGSMTVAALFVAKGGCYFGLPDVEPYDITRDARLYAGPWPVVAHPPCERWGRYWHGGPGNRGEPKKKGDDGGCFASALAAVRTWGGVLEHPCDSHAWRAFGLIAPPHSGGWVVADDRGGWTCRVDQGQFGHRARKATWLYAVRATLPSLPWARTTHQRSIYADLPPGPERRYMQRAGVLSFRCRADRAATPLPFRDLLLSMARSAMRERAAPAAPSRESGKSMTHLDQEEIL